jgi:cation diffusion facilitator CzcD-associated flavoprotein CzcO
MSKVCVIGAGCSGITAVKNLLQAGVTDLVCYEKSDQIGGNWVFREGNGHSSVYETTHLISSKQLSAYIDFPMPDDYPDYPSHRQILSYFKAYAKHFDLERHITFNTGVAKVEKIADERWRVTTDSGESTEFDYVMVCNGHHWNPRMPAYPGTFTGEMLHSHQFKKAAPFRDKRVLVVGAGNSGCDVAVEVSRVAAKCDISMRRGYYIVPKFMMGKPTDTFNETLVKLPSLLTAPLRRLGLWLQVGNYADYGLQVPDYPLLQSHPVANSELLYFLRHGKIKPRLDVARFEGQTVHFTNGESAEYDTVVAATGYHITFPFLDKKVVYFADADRIPLWLRTFHAEHKTLFFIGLVQPQGCIWPLSDYQAKLCANLIAGRWQLPQNLHTLAEQDADHIGKQFMATKRHAIEVHFHPFVAELKKAMPKNAPEWKA